MYLPEAQRLQDATLTPNILRQQAIEKWDGAFPRVVTDEGAAPLLQVFGEGA